MSDVYEIETAVIGAGAVGLACARALAMTGREVVVLERAGAIGTETSSRNSEVIHAGIYYPAGSLKARACVEGRRLLHAYLEAHRLPYRQCGKFIVATDEAQAEALPAIAARARENGVEGTEEIDAVRAVKAEPQLSCLAALHSPVTGILDSHAYMLSLQGEFEDHGGVIAFHAEAEAIEVCSPGFVIQVGGDAPMRLHAREVVNAAGLHAPALGHRIEGLDPAFVPAAHFAKGSYFALSGRAPFSRLIYPAPEQAGLGIHLTLDMGGQARFGPDVEWVEPGADGGLDYSVDPARGEIFYEAIRRYWPALPAGALVPAYAGIRPKLQNPGEPPRDFCISGPDEHGLAGLVNLFGIESPGLTASLSLADYVVARLDEEY
ncbi:L-2-hydroxyglutarate oxidase LhgO [Parvibaculum indicum]|uniref:FAD-dependent oxidoreductase n=1 Tax=Parvibaculum indicum TaxID=562969 RepID=UPI0014214EE1|nr:L-2-hydroxyglutarate oxidase LhgO [Parvibaculum indicum]